MTETPNVAYPPTGGFSRLPATRASLGLVPKVAEQAIGDRGGAVRWRSRCRDGHLWRFAITRKAGPKGGKVVAYDTGKRC